MIPEATIEATASALPPGATSTLLALYTALSPFLWPVLLALIGWGISILKKHGYQTTYATAIARALGAGVLAAKDAGLDPFASTAGRAIVIATGAKYLQDNVGDAAKALGIDTMDAHADRVKAEMGSVIGQAEATALATVGAVLPISKIGTEVTSDSNQPSLPNILGAH